MKCYVGPAAARQDPTPSDKMQLSASFTSVRSQGTCTLFYWKGLNALINSAAFFCNFTQQLMRRTGKIHRRSLNITFWWFSKLNSFNVLTILRFRWTASVCCVLLSIGFWHRCRLFSPHLSDEYFLDSMLGNSSPFISIKKKTIFLHSAWREAKKTPHHLFWAHLSSLRILFNIGEKPVFNDQMMDFYRFTVQWDTRLVSEFISSYRMLLSTIVRHFKYFQLPSTF